ncbi:MAG: SHOCT domain-containing protein, partial [Clostridia bacterium]|nr:SHOCT domain-containing protein [Clostridia bacterium]
LIFINLIAGILMFCDANSEEKTVVKVDNNDMETKLKQYKNLLDQGLITQEEFDTKRKEILKL